MSGRPDADAGPPTAFARVSLRVTRLGQSGFLFEAGGRRVLVDPFFDPAFPGGYSDGSAHGGSPRFVGYVLHLGGVRLYDARSPTAPS